MPQHRLSRISLVALTLASGALAVAAPALAQQIEHGGGRGSDGSDGGGGGGGGGFGLPGGGWQIGLPGSDEAGGAGGGHDGTSSYGRGGVAGGTVSGDASLSQGYSGVAGGDGVSSGAGGGGTGLVLKGGGTVDTAGQMIVGGGGGIGAWPSLPGVPHHGSGGGGTGLLVLDGGTVTVSSGMGVTGGAGASSMMGMGAGGGAGLFLRDGGAVLNSSFVQGGAGGVMTGSGTGGTGGAGLLANGGTITNEMAIAGGSGGNAQSVGATAGTGGAGIEAWGTAIVNRGAIFGGSAGTPVDGPAGRGGAGVILRDGAVSTIVNEATITGGTGGWSSSAGGPAEGGTGGSAIEVGGAGAGTAVSVVTNKTTVTSTGTNVGTITGGAGGGGTATGGDAGVGILFRGVGGLDNAGDVKGGAGGAGDGNGHGGRGAAAVVLEAGGTIVNSGLLQGGSGGGGNGRAAGGGGGTGVIASGGTIENSGRIVGGTGGSTNWDIAGSGGAGIQSDGTAITNRAAGEIIGGAGGLPTLRGGSIINGGAGVQATGGSIDNDGRIAGGDGAPPFGGTVAKGVGGVGIQADGTTITNRGTIVGGDGTFALNGPSAFYGPGGAGISGSALTIVNTGTVSGGLSGYTRIRALAIALTGGASRLTMGPTGRLDGGIDIAGGASLTLDQSANDTTIAGAITGAGSLIKTGTATVILSATATYSGGTTISGGVLQFQAGAQLGTGLVTLDGGTLRNGEANGSFAIANGLTVTARGGTLDAGSGSIWVAKAISDVDGGGTLTIAGNGGATSGVFLGEANSYHARTHVTETAQLWGLTLGSLSPNSDHIVDGTLNTTYVTALTLRSLSGAATGRVVAAGTDDRTLTLAMPDGTADFAGTIFDSVDGGRVSVVKTGAGHQVFSGTSSYTGNTTVDGGTLSVNGSIVSSPLVTVNAGGTLGGTGTVGEVSIKAGGTLAPGNSIGTLTVQGGLTFAAGSTYAVEVSPLGSDRVNVAGTATLGGATVAAFYAPGAYVTKRYTILTAGSVGGSFAGPVNTNLPANFSVALKQDATSVSLDLTLNYVPGGPDPGGPNPGGPNPGGPNPGGPTPPRFGSGLSLNQANVANALVTSFNTAGGIPLVFGALTPAGLSGASGEAATGIQTATLGVMSRFLNLMTDPYSNGRNASVTEMADLAHGPRGVIVAEPARWSAWASGYGGVQATGGNAAVGSHGTATSIYGSAFGADYRLSPDTVIGFALGAAGTSYRLGQGLGGGSSDVFQIGLYGRHQIGAAYIAAALAYGWQDVTTERRFMGDRLTGRFTTQAFSGRIETGYRFATGFAGLTPYAAGEVVSLATAGYREQVTSGSGLFALDYAGRSATAWRTELGLRADKAIRIGEAELVLRGRLAWAHNVNPNAIVSASFTSLPASGFVVQGAREAPNALLTSAGAELKWANGWSAAATFEGSFSGRGSSYAGRGTLRYQW